MATKTARQYGGQSPEERARERREKLMRAAADLYGRLGPAGASVTAICSEAGLTPRYFYESFQNREALLLAVFRVVCERMLEQVRQTADTTDPIGTGLAAFFHLLAEHPDLARVFLVEIDHHDPEMRVVGRATMDALARILMPHAEHDLAKAGAIGAILRIARLWIERGAVEAVSDLAEVTRCFVEAGEKACGGQHLR
jgi:AcrR family transcriptional regulator